MPQYERGHSGQEIGEMQQRLADLGYEVTPTYEFDEHTEDALRRYQVDWLYADGTGVADEETLAQLEYHHSNRDGGQLGGPQYGEEPVYDGGAGGSAQVSEDGQHWWDGQQWNPFANPTPVVDQESQEPQFGLLDEETIEKINREAREYGQGGQGYGGGEFDPFANPTPVIDSGTIGQLENAAAETYQQAGELWDGAVDQASKIISGEEPMPDVRN